MLPLRISVKHFSNSGDPKIYGSLETTAKQIEMKRLSERLPIANQKGKTVGYISFNQLDMDMRPSLAEYLQNGWQMNVTIAIDFTLSNREIKDQRSLHR